MPQCASKEKIEQFFYPNTPKLQYVYVNSSFEFSAKDISKPVKLFADDSFFFPLELTRQIQTNLYLRQSQFTIEKQFSLFSEDKQIFHKIEDAREYSQPWVFPTNSNSDLRINRVFLRLDDKQDFIEVRLYTLFAFMSNLGGIGSFMLNAGGVLTSFLAYDLFIASLMKMLIAVNLLNPKTET
jgi:hypothetical protein